MYEENRRFSWTGLFIKIIIVVIFILFTIWLLSLSTKNATKGLSDSLNVLTDQIFSDNISKMKEVGKEYFTTERLPEKVGDVKTLSLQKMYDSKLLLELKDKNGKACSAKNSYVSVEKLETEYQMKVYLECGDEADYVVTIMGCYNYCNTDICEKKTETKEDNKTAKNLEYQYSKTTGGKWTDWGAFTNWTNVSVTKTNYRDVETKVVKESYTYDKEIKETIYVNDASICQEIDGYNLVSESNGVCHYEKPTIVKTGLTCPEVSGYKNTGISGTTCSYKQITPSKTSLICPEVSGYKNTGISGTTCNYKKNTATKTDPLTCPSSYNDYSLTSQNGFTCNYAKTVQSESCTSVPVGKQLVSTCSGCGASWQTVYETRCETVYNTNTASTEVGCPAGYAKDNNTCVKYETTTGNAICPNGYTKDNNTCVKYETMTKGATCPKGYTKDNNTCVKSGTEKTTKNAICLSKQKLIDGKCYEEKKSIVTVEGTKNVTYYRYRLREYIGGTTDYKWSSSNNDKTLINAGYKLTGKTREVGGK